MRNRFNPFVILISVILLGACQKQIDLDATNTNGFIDPGVGDFEAKIDGVQWSANSVTTATIQNGVIAIYGSNTDGKSILLRVADSGQHVYSFTAPATANLGAFTDSSLASVAAFTTNAWPIDSVYGSLHLTSIDTVNKVMSGTFSMNVFRSIDTLQRNITDGVFTNIPYSTQPHTQSPTDTFRVKIDGNDFVYNSLSAFAVNNHISVTGAINSTSVGITVPDTVHVGTFTYDISDYVGTYNIDASTFLAADTGHLTILEHDLTTHRIRGNFNFHANVVFTHVPPEAELTEGYFSVIYQ